MATSVLKKRSSVRTCGPKDKLTNVCKERTSASSKRKVFVSDATFQHPDLEAAFIQYCQMMLHGVNVESASQWKKRIAVDEIELIGNPMFDSSNAESDVLGSVLLGTGIPTIATTKSTRVVDLPSHLVRLCETRLLTPDEERQLFRRMNFLRHVAIKFRDALGETDPTEWQRRRIEGLVCASNWYRDLIVKSNMRLVISIVKKFVNNYNSFDDLLSDGIMALMRAVDKFDYDRGFRFSTYATQVVRRNAYRNVMSKQKERSHVATSIHDPGVDICARDENSTLSIERWNDLRSKLGLLLDQLDRREKLIVRARFSLGSHSRVQTLQYLADKLGVSKERVRQLEKRALEKLRDMAGQVKLPEMEI